MKLPNDLQTIGPKELATILQKSESTIRRNASRAPHTLPPRIQNDQKKNPMVWRIATVQQWLNNQEQKQVHA